MLSATIKYTPVIGVNKDVDKLKFYTSVAADNVRPFIEKCNISGYKNFLNTMYHYTIKSEDQLRDAQQLFSDESDIYEYFEVQAKEERGHYLLAKRDLEEFGEEPETHATSEIIAFREFWDSITKDDRMQYLGAQYVFENVAGQLGKAVLDMIARLQLNKKQSRWLIVHLEADVGHGAEIEKICLSYLNSEKDQILEGARAFCELWSSVFKKAFENK